MRMLRVLLWLMAFLATGAVGFLVGGAAGAFAAAGGRAADGRQLPQADRALQAAAAGSLA